MEPSISFRLSLSHPKFLCLIPSIVINHLLGEYRVLFRNFESILIHMCPTWCLNDRKEWSMLYLGHVALCLKALIAGTFPKGS